MQGTLPHENSVQDYGPLLPHTHTAHTSNPNCTVFPKNKPEGVALARATTCRKGTKLEMGLEITVNGYGRLFSTTFRSEPTPLAVLPKTLGGL